MSIISAAAAAAVAVRVGPSLLWSTTTESATSVFYGWPTGAGGWDNGDATREQSSEQAHTGTFSAKCTIDVTAGDTGVRLAHTGQNLLGDNIPDTCYYSAWLYFPSNITIGGGGFHNPWQWKRGIAPSGSTVIFNYSIANRAGGEMYVRLLRRVDSTGAVIAPVVAASSAIDIPVAQWTHFEALYTWSTTEQGQVRGWQDGVEIWNLTNLTTDFTAQAYLDRTTDKYQWSVNNYGNSITPNPYSLYIDDAALSNNRIYGLWP